MHAHLFQEYFYNTFNYKFHLVLLGTLCAVYVAVLNPTNYKCDLE